MTEKRLENWFQGIVLAIAGTAAFLACTTEPGCQSKPSRIVQASPLSPPPPVRFRVESDDESPFNAFHSKGWTITEIQ